MELTICVTIIMLTAYPIEHSDCRQKRFAKLASLLIKTVAKPVSKRIKRDFARFPVTRQLLIGIGQTSHSVTSRMTIWSNGYIVRHITPLEEDKALGTGADFVGESFILVVSSGLVIWEYNKSQEKQKQKDEKHRADAKAEREALQENFRALDERLRALEEVVKYNSDSLLNIGGKKYVPPKKRNLVPIPESADSKEMSRDNNEHNITQMQQPEATGEAGGGSSKKSWWILW